MSDLFLVAVLVFDIAAVVDILGSAAEPVAKVLWILLVLALPIVGMIVYFAVGKKRVQA